MTRTATFPSIARRGALHALLAATAFAAAALGGAASARADVLANIQKAGVVRVAIPQDFPPFGSLGTDLKPQATTSTWPTWWPRSWA